MRAIAAIRTNRWGEEEARLFSALRPVFGSELAVVFHNRPTDLSLPLPVVDIGSDWVTGAGLAAVPDWGWRCGDYFYYALRAARPDYDQYWLIEPDVHFTSSPADFFARFSSVTADVLAYDLGPFTRDIRFTRGLPGLSHYQAVFAMTRFSGRALDRLFAARRDLSSRPVSLRNYPNDEIFSFSKVMNDSDLDCRRLEEFAADWYEESQFTSDPDLLYDMVEASAPAGKVLHPVRSRGAFVRSLGMRLSANTGILSRMDASIEALSAEDIERVAQISADNVRAALQAVQRRRARGRRREARNA
ncbi:component of SufBCD complex [Frigidibacter sp. RF13]|uniref:component of SufBCD complex n=1 Tax=Frigidibacter sp. RF13 TaxID=2997340 RepID=UPI00226F4691|nr:component of SufBCD complex [Frigidibacter sp. RF13]MCY1125497.1 component of SufBCD complex [Frigidibacter sp. RF13]